MAKLSSKDILIDASVLAGLPILEQWPNTVSGRLRLIGASAFGDLYFERADGSVERLDVLEGGVARVADSFEQFTSMMNDPSWYVEALLTVGVALLTE